ncbi:MAG: DUF4129 domain-containing protein [Ruegeria sp.]|uniref:DUF4129 domain-containing protein n=1 Tax=Ruegeria sp. TaxID=1879320 RepID=UPI00349EB16D
MRCVLALLFPLCVCVISAASAQQTVVGSGELTESGSDYLRALRYKGIESDVVYFDPTQPAPELKTDAIPEVAESEAEATPVFSTDGRVIVGIASFLVLLGLLALVYFNGSGVSVPFGKTAANRRRQTLGTTNGEVPADQPMTDLNAILKLTDRRVALTRLAQYVLTRCLVANDILFQRSWTQREALQRLPKSQPYLAELRALVLESERVNFGGRSISEAEFDRHVSGVRSLLPERNA